MSTVIMKICHVTLQCTGFSVCNLNKMLVIKIMTVKSYTFNWYYKVPK